MNMVRYRLYWLAIALIAACSFSFFFNLYIAVFSEAVIIFIIKPLVENQ